MGQYGKAVMYDSKVQVAAGQDKAWALQAGSLAPVYFTFNDNGLSEGAGVQYGANYIKSVVRDPQSGLPIDLTISDACGSVSIIARSCAKLCALPTDLYGTGDPQEGVTGFAGIKVVNV
jgi:thiamine biosynthesis lipoprotein ApbE